MRAIVHGAVAADPAQRHASAHVFLAQLVQWSGHTVPAAPATAKATSVKDDGAFERLLRRMQDNEDFPAMTHAVPRIQAMAVSALLLLPMRLNDKPFTLIYAGMVDQPAPTLTERQLASLRPRRDRAQLALRQAR